jgi:hypothetical protein
MVGQVHPYAGTLMSMLENDWVMEKLKRKLSLNSKNILLTPSLELNEGRVNNSKVFLHVDKV